MSMYSQLTQRLHKAAQPQNVKAHTNPGGQSFKHDSNANNYNGATPQYSKLLERLAPGHDRNTEQTPLRGHYGEQQASVTRVGTPSQSPITPMVGGAGAGSLCTRLKRELPEGQSQVPQKRWRAECKAQAAAIGKVARYHLDVKSEGWDSEKVNLSRRFEKVKTEQPEDSDSDGFSSGLEPEQNRVLDDLLQNAAPDGTSRQDKSHWKTWCKVCEKAKFSPWRTKELKTAKQKRRERRKTAYVTWLVNQDMKPRRKSDPVAKPSSAYQVYLGAKRVHKRKGYVMEHGELVVIAMKAITKQFIQKWGFKHLVKKRKEPFTRSMIVGFLRKDWPVLRDKVWPSKGGPKIQGLSVVAMSELSMYTSWLQKG